MNSFIFGCYDNTKDHAVPSESLDFSVAEYFDLEELKNVEILPIFSDTNVFVDQMRYCQVTERYYIFITAQYIPVAKRFDRLTHYDYF